MTEKTTTTSKETPLLDEAERCMSLGEAALIEEIKLRRMHKKPGISSEKFKEFRKLLFQRVKETGALDREYAEELLQEFRRGEL